MEVVWVFLVEHDTEETKFILESVGHEIEHLILIIVNDLFDGLDLVFLIQIDPNVLLNVVENGVFAFSDDCAILGIVQREELWLLWKRRWEFAQGSNDFSHVIKLDDLVLLGEEKSVGVLSFNFGNLEMELHT